MVDVEIPTICAPLLRSSVPQDKLKGFESLHLVDDYLNSRHVSVDTSIGLDAYWNFTFPNRCYKWKDCLPKSLSLFGCCRVRGMLPAATVECVLSSCVLMMFLTALHDFWDLQSIGIHPKEVFCDESTSTHVEQRFNENVKFRSDRYEVALPWKFDLAKAQLQDKDKLARKRLDSLCRKFKKDQCMSKRELLRKFLLMRRKVFILVHSIFPIAQLYVRAALQLKFDQFFMLWLSVTMGCL